MTSLHQRIQLLRAWSGSSRSARLVGADFKDAARPALRVASRHGLAPLGIVNVGGEVRRPQFRELSTDADPRFLQQQPVTLDPGEAR
jgi:hypothetical protein